MNDNEGTIPPYIAHLESIASTMRDDLKEARGLGSRAYHVPADVWPELPRFQERWQKVVEAGGINSPEQLQMRVRTILALPSVEH
jgi:hypothetical protein